MASNIRPFRIVPPPTTGDAALDSWARSVTNAINGLPISIFSTSDGPNESGVTAPEGFLGVEVGSSTTKFWYKRTGSDSTGWSHFSNLNA